LALALGGIPFEDKRVEFAEWQGLKPKTPFGQLPVLSIDDGPFRAQSLALLRWVGSELAPQLYPKNQLLDIEEALGVLDDFDKARNPALSLNSFPEKYGHAHNWHKTEEGQATIKALREKVVSETLPKYASFLEAMLSKNDNQWLASKDSPTLADCVAVPFLRSFTLGHLDHIPVDSLDKYPVLVEYVKRFCSLPQIHGRYSKGLY
jgi:glutathione S-transferase